MVMRGLCMEFLERLVLKSLDKHTDKLIKFY